MRDFWPRWRRRQIGFASSKNQKDNNKFKIKKNQNCQKIKLYRSLTTKELKKKHASRLVGGVEMGSHGRENSQLGDDWRTRGQGCGWQMGVGKVAAAGPDSPTFACG